jgi:tetratricopeptide (TPR) repeat protein
MTAKLCAELGLLSELKKLIARAEKDEWPPKYQVQIAKGALAFAEGQNAEAILQLRGAVDALRGVPLEPSTLVAEDLLAGALEKQGDFAGAIDALRPMELNDGQGPDLDARYHLARLYRKVGNEAEAQSIETDLLKRLKYADRDHPILVQLNRQTRSLAARP